MKASSGSGNQDAKLRIEQRWNDPTRSTLLKIDNKVSTWASKAKSTYASEKSRPKATESRKSADFFFQRLTASLRPKIDTAGRIPLTIEQMFGHPTRQSNAGRQIEEKLLAMRIDIESALLRLDQCLDSQEMKSNTWPTGDLLKEIDQLVHKITSRTSKRAPRILWNCYLRVDNKFPKLKLCQRVERFLSRVEKTKPRPLGIPMEQYSAEAVSFFQDVQATRGGAKQPFDIDWSDHRKLLLEFKKRCKLNKNKTSQGIETQMRNKIPGEPRTYFYVAFLELDRQDLIWAMRYNRHVYLLITWFNRLGNTDFIKRLDPFCAGPVCMAESLSKQVEEINLTFRRWQNNLRKAKSRGGHKKVLKKV